MKTHAEVVVIGGGVMGCSLLYHLSKLGWRDAVLVEKNELTAGSTWHAAGLCTHYAHNLTVMNLRAHSVRLYRSILPKETGRAVSFHATGALRITGNQDRMDEFRHVQGLGKVAGFDFHILSPTELKEIYPPVQTAGILGAIYEPLDGYVDPSQATHAFAAGARAGGAEIYRRCAVTAIHRRGDEWLVQTENGTIRAAHIVNAAGTWCREIGAMMGVDVPAVPMLHQYIVTTPIADFARLPQELPMIRDPDESWYMRQEQGGVIIGAYEKNGVAWAVDGVPPEFGRELLPAQLERIEAVAMNAMARVPAAAHGGVKTVVHGPITFTPDANPLIGPAFGLPDAWLLTGSSMGVMEGGGAGAFLAEWMTHGEPPMDALAVDSRRFGEYADRDYRVAKAVESFAAQFAIHYPYEERTAARRQRVTPIYPRLKELGAVFGAVYGWERPNWFARRPADQAPLSFARPGWFDAVADECETVSRRVGVADLSVFAKFEVSGADAMTFVETLGANHAPTRIGGIVLTHALTPSGGIHSEFTVTRLAEHRFYLTSAAAAERRDHDLLRAHATRFADLALKNVTRDYAVLGVMGPFAGAVLAKLSDADLSQAAFPWLSARAINIGGVAVTALRISYVGEAGWELHHEMRKQPEVLAKVLDAGAEFGIAPFGALAMNAMRLEKGYRGWGGDLTSERTPLESGLEAFVKPGGTGFCGETEMLRRQSSWRLCLLEVTGDARPPFYHHAVCCDEHTVGLVTSAAFGHRVGKTLALAWLRETPGQGDLAVSILGEMAAAKVLDAAPYDARNLRCKA